MQALAAEATARLLMLGCRAQIVQTTVLSVRKTFLVLIVQTLTRTPVGRIAYRVNLEEGTPEVDKDYNLHCVIACHKRVSVNRRARKKTLNWLHVLTLVASSDDLACPTSILRQQVYLVSQEFRKYQMILIE